MKRLAFFLYFLSVLVMPSAVFAQVDYGPLAKVFRLYLDEQGHMDYSGLRKDRQDLDRFIAQIAYEDISLYPEKESKAFWLNVCNALTLEAVINNYPVEGLGRVWRVWDTPKRVAGGHYTLNDIQNKIIRTFKDPRVHFAITFASLSSPKLSKEPFYPAQLEEQLNQQAIRVINDPDYVRMDRQNKTVFLSSIFKLYQKDFLEASASLKDYIKTYLNPEAKAFVEDPRVTVQYMPYDWRLNDTQAHKK